MAGHYDGAAGGAAQIPNQFPHFHHTLRIQADGGFIQQQQFRVAQQGGGDAQPLPHSGGTLPKGAVGRRAGQADLGQQPLYFLRVAAPGINALETAQVVPAG